MIWILIIYATVANSQYVTITTQKFNTQEACVAVGERASKWREKESKKKIINYECLQVYDNIQTR